METSIGLKKILLIQTAFLGDVVLATAVIEALSKAYPKAQIDFLLKKGNEGILDGHPVLNEVIVFDKKRKVKSLISIIKKIRSKKYDLLINMHRFGSSGLMAFLSNAVNICGFDKNPFSFCYDYIVPHVINTNSPHETQRNLQLIEPFTIVEDNSRPRLYLSEEDKQSVKHYKELNYVCIAPASVWYTKQLPKEKWIQLIRVLKQKVERVYLIGGPADKPLCDSIKDELNSDYVINLAAKLSIKESIALMKDAVLNYVNDSGPLHFASSVNAPVCAVFCSTVPGFGFGPMSDFSIVVEVTSALACRPCNLHGQKTCPHGHFKCADIDITELLSVYDEAKQYHSDRLLMLQKQE